MKNFKIWFAIMFAFGLLTLTAEYYDKTELVIFSFLCCLATGTLIMINCDKAEHESKK